jgi:hypothetical protein
MHGTYELIVHPATGILAQHFLKEFLNPTLQYLKGAHQDTHRTAIT